MASDWIKMRTDLYRDPKVSLIAEALLVSLSDEDRNVTVTLRGVTRNVLRNAVVGALVSVWGVIRHQGRRVDDDLALENVPLRVIDDIADLPGFGSAMLSVGWVVEADFGLYFPRFFEQHNADPGVSQRAKNAERQRRFREKNRNVTSNADRNVTGNVTVTPRVEKSREEKEEYPPNPPRGEPSAELSQEQSEPDRQPAYGGRPAKRAKQRLSAADMDYPPGFDSPEVRAALDVWLDYRREIGKPYKSRRSIQSLVTQWQDRGPPRFLAAVQYSTAQGYQGLFEQDSNGKSTAGNLADRLDRI